jgi:hypothetical protein
MGGSTKRFWMAGRFPSDYLVLGGYVRSQRSIPEASPGSLRLINARAVAQPSPIVSK